MYLAGATCSYRGLIRKPTPATDVRSSATFRLKLFSFFTYNYNEGNFTVLTLICEGEEMLCVNVPVFVVVE